jgi:hypothetical protein
MSGSRINSIFGYAPAVALFNRPSYSSAVSAFNDGFKRLRLSNVDSRLRRIDGYGDRVLLDTSIMHGLGHGLRCGQAFGRQWLLPLGELIAT